MREPETVKPESGQACVRPSTLGAVQRPVPSGIAARTTNCHSGTGVIPSLLALLLLAGMAGGSGAVQPGGSEKSPAAIFAFDDFTIPFKLNLKLTMAAPRKHARNPVLAPGPAGSTDNLRAQFYGSVIREGEKLRMWYVAVSGSGMSDLSRYLCRVAYAESRDGVEWSKPALGLTDFNGSTKNNLVRMIPELDYRKVEQLACFVLHEPEDPDPARRYKMAVYGRYDGSADPRTVPDNVPTTIYPYFSPDGLTWKLAGPMPKGAWPTHAEVPFTVRNNFEIGGLYKFDGIYYVAGQELWPDISLPDGSPVRRTMVTHWSGDFIRWSQDKSFSFQRHGYRSVSESLEEAHEPAGIWNRGNVLLGLYGLWHGASIKSDRRMDLGFLVSNDGIHFREPIPDRVFIPAGRDGEWDQRGLLHGQGYLNIGDETYIYYGSWDLSSATPFCAIGLATLRRDGFGWLSTHDGHGGQFTTVPLAPGGREADLFLNVDGLGPDAALRIELIDRLGEPIPGFSGDTAALVRESGFRVRVAWPGKPVIRVTNRAVRARVGFTGTRPERIRFYAAYLEGRDQ